MKILMILFLLLNGVIVSQEVQLRGKVLDIDTYSPLKEANIFVSGREYVGTSSSPDGKFELRGEISEYDLMIISFVGYHNYSFTLNDLQQLPALTNKDGNKIYLFYLKTKIISSQTVL